MDAAVVFAGAYSAWWCQAPVLLCSRSGWQRARVLRSGPPFGTGPAFLWFSVTRTRRPAAAAYTHREYGGALHKRDARSPAHGSLLYRWPNAGPDHCFLDGF